MEEEQVFTISLSDAKKAKRRKRSAKAVKIVKEYLKKHLKVKEVKIDDGLNREIWNRGIERPPAQIRVRAVKLSDETAEAFSLE
ncbi:50S ribosomal protein L31 [candidate division MSBL1 archaeon SCGC-AAA259B11]|uniref:Large ribosomal subunit protein eL31 n=1 Tax=candidate division MSBL1 archaeon SCGC-AAA259B11 TaxID=1698260 RepID=A0A133U5M2_9EURY|nr:50S ribosomal protein L31 [candidate division MSBL1 archaeon SCGC-AAA259B11]